MEGTDGVLVFFVVDIGRVLVDLPIFVKDQHTDLGDGVALYMLAVFVCDLAGRPADFDHRMTGAFLSRRVLGEQAHGRHAVLPIAADILFAGLGCQ